MNMNRSIYLRSLQPSLGSSRQSGATLIIVLILLILITLFGMASVRGTLLQERMVSGTLANQLAFQAAEAGLRQAEANLAADPDPQMPDSGCDAANGYCARWDPNDVPLFAQAGFWQGSAPPKTADTEIVSGKFKITPKYIIEDFGKGEIGVDTATDRGTAFEPSPPPPPKLYRITAYAQAPGTEAETILQSIYVR